MSDSQPSWIGRTLGGRYQIDSLLGTGGMSSVYKATDPNLRRTVAIKLIHPHLSGNPQFVKRFEQEATAVAKLRHPNIMLVHDFSHEQGVYFIVFEYIAGESLQDRLAALKDAHLRLPLPETIDILVTLCSAVGYAHERNMIHRDLKPSNVIINLLGQPILLDFGIAKIVGSDQVHTATGATIGTATYMSPEQVMAEKVDYRADIYSLGVMLYEMVAGVPPFEGDSVVTVMMKHMQEPLPDIRQLNRNVPDALIAILEKALAKKPEDRFRSAVTMASALEALSQEISDPAATQSITTSQPAPTPVPGEPDPTMIQPSSEAATPAESQPSPAEATPTTSSVLTPAEGLSTQPARRSRPTILLASALAILAIFGFLVIVSLGAYFLVIRPRQTLPSSEGMVNIPAGTYTVGSDNGGSQYTPVQQLELSEFWIDKFEVTNALYTAFLVETGSQPPSDWKAGAAPDGQENYPVQGVTWDMATAYCQWEHKRLPTEAEWEAAARSPQGFLYPWGNSEEIVQLPQDSTYSVGTVLVNRSDFGAYDMAGNVWEWVGETYAPVPSGQRVLHGGAYNFHKDMAFRLSGNPDVPTMVSTAGFRCGADTVEIVPDADLLLEDDFTDEGGGWPTLEEGSVKLGYHPPDNYHVQSGQSNSTTSVFFGGRFDNIAISAEVSVDSTDTDSGDFRYGLVLRQEGDQYYAFTISPRAGIWYVLKSTSDGLQVLAQGSEESLQGMTSTDRLRVDASGNSFVFSINGRVVTQLADADYVAGDIGFLVETFDETRAHIHYDRLTVHEIDSVPVSSVLFRDNFSDPNSGWPSVTEDSILSGYHPPDYYHVQSGEPRHRSLAFFDQSFDDIAVETEVFVESTDTQDGDFFYGLVVRRQGEQYYGFLISPRTRSWQVLKNSATGQEVLAEGDDDSIQGLTTADMLRVDATGNNLIYFINGRAVVRVNDSEYSSGDIGFIVETLNESQAHIHYDSVLIRQVEDELTEAPAAEPIAVPSTATPSPTREEPTPVLTEAPSPTPTLEGPVPSSQGMVKVDEGSYVVASDTAVDLAAFWIDRYEVTNSQYAAFLNETGQAPPDYWSDADIPAEMGDYPVQGVPWDLAAAYCHWTDKRLPTEFEWEVAARGPNSWLYPWGDDQNTVALATGGSYPVGSIPANRSFFGVFDMAANVWEWVDAPYTPLAEGEQVLRGGANNFQQDMTFSVAGDPNSSIMNIDAGVRCAADQIISKPEDSLLFSDDFSAIESGWFQARAPVNAYFYGYHPTDFYHVQVRSAAACLSIYREIELDNFMAEVEIFIAATDTEEGDFRYGLTIRQADSEFYAFIVSPRTQTWQVVKSVPAGLALMDEGSQAFIRGDSQATRERLFIIANGPEFTFFVNGELVSRVYDREYDGGNLGFIVETLDETYAHVHFDSITVWELPAGTAAPSTPPAAGDYAVVSPLCGGSVTEANTLVNFTSHTVEEGETMSAIALQYGVTVAEIWGANGKTVDNPSLIRTAQTLVIPQP